MKKLTDKEKINALNTCFDDVIWMAIRYAHGRHTYAPGMVRRAITEFQKIFPGWRPKNDAIIKEPNKDELTSPMSFESDYLNDLFKIKK